MSNIVTCKFPGFDSLILIADSYKRLGSKSFKNGATAIGIAPFKGESAYLHNVFPVCTTSEIDSVEKKLGFQIPRDFRGFLLKKMNGIDLFSGTLSIFGFKSSRRSDDCQPYDILLPNTLERPDWLGKGNLIVGSYSWNGSLVVMSSQEGVTLHEAENGKSICKWTSLDRFFESESRRLLHFFSLEGRKLIADANTEPPNEAK